MQPAFRINIRNLPRQVTPTCTRTLSSTPRNMAFFPQPQMFSPFFRLIDEVERSISQPQNRGAFSSCVPAVNRAPTPTFSPRVNVSEEQTQYLLQAEVAGYEQKDVEIEWTDVSTLTISGRQQQHTESVENDKTPAAMEAAPAPASPTLSAHQASVEDTVDEDTPNRDEWVDLPSVDTESTTTAAAPTPATTISQPATPAISQPQTKYWVKERSVGQFSRSFQFPNRVDHDNVKASLKNGVLSVVVPKAKVPEKRRIVVE